jgi:hypothetical protein
MKNMLSSQVWDVQLNIFITVCSFVVICCEGPRLLIELIKY